MAKKLREHIGSLSLAWILFSIVLCFLVSFTIFKQFEFQPSKTTKTEQKFQEIEKRLNDLEKENSNTFDSSNTEKLAPIEPNTNQTNGNQNKATKE